MFAYARPITKGAEVADTNGFAGSRAAQITIPYRELLGSTIPRGTDSVATYDEAINEEFRQEQVSEIRLCRTWNRAQNASRTAI